MAALGIEQNKAQSELKQAALEKQQHSVIQPLACAPEHCVYICNLTYPLGSHRPPSPRCSFALTRSQPPCPYSFSPSHSVALIIASFPFSLTQRYSQANTPTRFLTLTPIHKHTNGLEDTPMCEDHAVLMCQRHHSLLSFSVNQKQPVTWRQNLSMGSSAAPSFRLTRPEISHI